MHTSTPQTISGRTVKRGKHTLIRITCPYCLNIHELHEGLRVPPCGSDKPDYQVKNERQSND